MPTYRDAVVIARPVDQVWAYLTDWFNTPRMGGYAALGLRQTSPGPTGVGSTLVGRNVILGFETRINHTITEWDPPRAMADRMEGRPFRSLTQGITLEAVDGGTRIVVTTAFELKPAMKLIWPIAGVFARRKLRTGIEGLPKLLDATAEPPPRRPG